MREFIIRLALTFMWFLIVLSLEGTQIPLLQDRTKVIKLFTEAFPIGLVIGFVLIGWVIVVPALLLIRFNSGISRWWLALNIWTRRVLTSLPLGIIAALGVFASISA